MQMSIKAVVTTLILGSSAVASAKPISQQAWEHEHDRGVRDREWNAERERLARERAEVERYRDRDRLDRDRIARLERERTEERERLMRVERERRIERERFERTWWARDHRYRSSYQVDPGYYGRTWSRPGYVSLIAPTALIQGPMYVSIAPELGTLSTIRLDGTGLTFVRKVVVEFDTGGVQEIPVGRWLDGGSPIELAISQSGCARRIVVYGQSEYGGQVAVTAA
jgi:hypothetical protein